MKKQLLCSAFIITLSSCTYLKYASIQSEYNRIHNATPGQMNLKHMIDKKTFYVLGKIINQSCQCAQYPMAIAAYSNKFKPNERVDTMYFANSDTHYGLNLPEGSYQLLVFADKNKNNLFEPNEVVGNKKITLNNQYAPENVLAHIDIKLNQITQPSWVQAIKPPVARELHKSLFFPGGTIRHLSDPIFDKSTVTLGMYDPAAFLEKVPTMFYALEEELSYKIPVIFVHGIAGSPREFEPIIQNLDRNRYKPWFFYYPSGGDLNQLATLFYQIFLSGKVIPQNDTPMIIIAHSMGGLVVREALNQYEQHPDENKVELLITMASPFGGHAAAATGEKHGLIVLPAWRDLNPNNQFINNLFRKPLANTINHQLIYAYQNDSTLKFGDNSDGVVDLLSQLNIKAQQQSNKQFGFNSTHTGILKDQEVIQYIHKQISQVKSIFPESHLKLLFQGGYNIPLNNEYPPIVRYFIQSVGKYLAGLSLGKIPPTHPKQEQFIQVTKGKIEATTDLEKAWIKFMKEYPELIK
ncbi:DUF413 domain-containing protein [Aliikangiella sp. IMCC44359]|uniref:DUF413 domain-containing protein n=1 Tax=Aliikangiella sp. IMCC44359 TaxID=3459125 RepID=UPI00403B286F